METERGKNSKPPDSSHEGTARAAESPKETTNNSLPQGDENKLKVELPGKEKFFSPSKLDPDALRVFWSN